ncbi:hypothetical protein GE09DRAFT_1260128 [Coniochaeta sp. 2T2.1]|nr:hypothetical protein GE09DRAFT_1260128 [Coniochaeta sp. 2T2.1]
MEVDDKPSPPDEMPAGFTTLPVEIRKMIYRFAVPNGYVFDVREQPTFKAESIVGSTPGALINRPPLDIMCNAHDFLDPVDNWVDEADDNDADSNPNDEDDASKSDSENHRGENGDGYSQPDSDPDGIDQDDSEAADDEDGSSNIDSQEDDLYHMRGIRIDRFIDASEKKPIFLPTIQSLLITCHQVREEVLDILYGENVFRVTVGKYTAERALRNGFHRSKVFRMKHIMLVYEQISPNRLGPELDFDRPVWNKILPNVVSLRLVLHQPLEEVFVHRVNCHRSIAQMRKTWAKDLPCALRYLDKKLAPTARLLVDCDNWKVTSRIIDRSLGRDWQHIRTTTGDSFFQRPDRWHRLRKWADKDFDDAPSECSCGEYEDSEFDSDGLFDSDGNPLDDISDIFPMYYDSDQYRGLESSSSEEDDNNDSDGSSSGDDDSSDTESSGKNPLKIGKSVAKAKGKAKAHHSVNDFFGEEYPGLAHVLTGANCNANMRHLSDKLQNAGPLSRLATSLGTVFETLNEDVCCLLQSKEDLEKENDTLYRELYQEEEEQKKLRKENDEQSSMINVLNYEIDLLEKDKEKLRKQVNKDLAAENAALATEVKKLKEQLAEKTASTNAAEDKTKEEKPMDEITEETAMEVDAILSGTN